jgi:hypothetical protein
MTMSARRPECLLLLMFFTFSGGCEKSRGSSSRNSREAVPVTFSWQGEGAGSVDFADDPRLYELLVDSVGLKWSISVVEGASGRQ